MDRLVVGTGRSRADDVLDAGWFAASEALAGLGGEPPGLIVVYGSARYDLARLVKAVRVVTGDTPLVGASSGGQFCEGEFLPAGAGAVVLALAGGPYRFGTASATGLRADAQETGRRLARGALAAVGDDRPQHGALLLLADGMDGTPEDLLAGVHAVIGAQVPVIGGAASADSFPAATYVLHDDEVLEDGAVAVFIGSDRPLRVVTGHGWAPTGLPHQVTAVDGQVVRELGGRPALEVYQESVRVEDPALAAAGAAHPSAHSLGLVQPDGSVLIRAAYVQDEQLRTFTPLPQFAAVRVVRADRDELLAVSERVIAEALDGTGQPAVLLVFSCVARMDLLGARAGEEAARLAAAAGVVPTFGFYTFGEFARTAGVTGYHNATIAALAL